MSRRTIAAVCFSLMAAGVSLTGVDAASARSAAVPQITGEQAKILKERIAKVQQRRKARISHLQRKAVAERAANIVAAHPVQKTAPAKGVKGVGR